MAVTLTRGAHPVKHGDCEDKIAVLFKHRPYAFQCLSVAHPVFLHTNMFYGRHSHYEVKAGSREVFMQLTGILLYKGYPFWKGLLVAPDVIPPDLIPPSVYLIDKQAF